MFAKKVDRYASAAIRPIPTLAPKPVVQPAINFEAEFNEYEREQQTSQFAVPNPIRHQADVFKTKEDLEYEEFLRQENDHDYEYHDHSDRNSDEDDYDDVQELGRNESARYRSAWADYHPESNTDSEPALSPSGSTPRTPGGALVLGRAARTPKLLGTPNAPRTPASPWSESTSSRVARALTELDSEEDTLVRDDIDFITGGDEASRPLPVSRAAAVQIVHVIPREIPENPLIKQKTLMEGVYEKNGKLLGDYFRRSIQMPVQSKTPAYTKETARVKRPGKARDVQVKKTNNAFAALAYDEVDEIEPQQKEEIEIKSEVDRESVRRACIAAAREEEDATEESETEEAPVVQPDPEVSEEVRARVAARMELKKADFAARRERAEAEREARMARTQATEAKSKSPTSSSQKVKKDHKLTYDLFYNHKYEADEARITLVKVHSPVTLMTLVGMICKKPDEIVKCRDDPTHMVPLPPLASASDIAIASPTRANVIHTPPIVASLCRNGTDCPWFRAQAYQVLGAPVPREYANARECNYMHIAREPLSLDGARFVQCSIQGCAQQQHYLPYDDETIHVIHMTPMTEECSHDQRNFCQNALGDGCCRRHRYAGPLFATMVMRAMLSFAQPNPTKWQVGDYSAMFDLWRRVVETGIPGDSAKFESRFKIPGIWPAQAPRPARTGKSQARTGKPQARR
jgi:hypothetical protein